MKEHYVTYDQAAKLKELGFDEPCEYCYNPDQKLLKVKTSAQSPQVTNNRYLDEIANRMATAPRLDQAQAWLREVKGIHISLNPYSISSDRYDGDNYFWSFELFEVPSGGWLKINGGGFDTYDLALSAGIDAALDLLTNKS